MSKQLMYVGVDVGKDEVWATLATTKPKSFAQSTAGVQALRAWMRKNATGARVHVCMEATGIYSQALALRLLTGADDLEVSIINPAQIKAFARAQLRRTKTDQVDAAVILAFAETQTPRPWSPEPSALHTLSRLVAHREALTEDLRRWTNRQHAASCDPRVVQAVDRSQAAIVRILTRELTKIEQALAALMAAEPTLAEQRAVLQTIPGIGPVASLELMAAAKGCLTARTSRQVTAHAGLAPAHRQSGSSVRGHSQIAKQGNVRLRTCLYMPVISAIRHNPVIRMFYQRLRTNGKPKKVALIACMRKLLVIARAILISKKPFDPAYQPLT